MMYEYNVKVVKVIDDTVDVDIDLLLCLVAQEKI